MSLISVLTSCFNAAEFLRESIDSVLAQSFRDFEYLLVDDGSSDETLEILKEYAARDPRIVVISKNHSGLTDSLNLGLQRARGEWVARLDTDDVALPERLERQLAFMRNRPEIILLGSGSWEMDRLGHLIRRNSYPGEHDLLIKNLEHLERFFPHSSAFFSRWHALDLGGYRPRMILTEDWDLWLRMGSFGKIACLQEPLVKLRIHSASISHQDGHRTQQFMGVAATICHLRKSLGHSDPSELEPEKWQRFLDWLEKKQEFEDYFQTLKARQSLRMTWYDHSKNSWMGRLKRLGRFTQRLTAQPRSLEILRQRLWGTDLAVRLAKESTQIFP